MTAPAPAASTATAFRPETREVAMQIFVELVARNVVVEAGSVKMAVSAENLARLAYKLAYAFLVVHEELNASNMPTNPTYKLDSDDIASWTK